MSYEEFLPLVPPKLAMPKAVRAAVDTLNRLTKSAAAANELVATLEKRLETLADEQRQAAANAYLAGREPTLDPKAAERVTEELEAAKREAAALEDAKAMARRQAVDAIGTNVDPWRRALDPELATARAELRAAVDSLDTAGRRLADAEATATWIANWPRAREFGGSPGPILRGTGPYSANRDPLPWSVVVDALRATATPPEPKPPRPKHTPAQLAGAEVIGPRRRAPVGDAA